MQPNFGNAIERFVLVVGLLGMLLVVGFVGLVVGSASYEHLLAIREIKYSEFGFHTLALQLTHNRYHLLREGLLASAIGGLLPVALWWRLHWIRAAATGLLDELRHSSAGIRKWWGRLPVRSRWVGLGLLAALVLLRVWYVAYYPLDGDEVTSYDEFVSNGPLVITTYYPIPNNHVLYNLLAWPFAATGFSPRLAMRLPTLLLGTLGTTISYALLARLIGLRRAMLVVGVVALNRLWVYYGAAGRGYFLQICLLQWGFFATAELLLPASSYRRLSWLVFIGSSVLGLYLIPTYVYPLVGLGVGLGVGFILQRRFTDLRTLCIAGGIITLLTVVLYLPIGTVSGWDQLLSNRYVVTQPIDQFWAAYRDVLYERAAELFGPLLFLGKPLLAVWLALATLGGLASRRWVPAGPTRILAQLAWVQLTVPLLLMAVQRVYAPTRVLVYLTFFCYLLVVLLLSGLPWRRWLATKHRWSIGFTAIVCLCLFFLYHSKFYMQGAEQETQRMQRAYAWLSAQQTTSRPVKVWMDAPRHELFYSYYARLTPNHPLELSTGSGQLTAGSYDFLMLGNDLIGKSWRPTTSYRPAYHDEQVTIYAPVLAATHSE